MKQEETGSSKTRGWVSMEGREWRTGRPHQSCGTAASPELRTAERPARSGQMFPANGHTVTILGLGVSQLNCAPQNSRGRTKSQHLRMRLHLEETSSKQLAKLHSLAWAPIHHDSCPREKSRTRTMAEGRPCAAPGLHTTEAVSYTHLTLPTRYVECRSRWSPYH